MGKKTESLQILSPLEIMRLLDAICPLSEKEKIEYKKKWKHLSLYIKIKYYTRNTNYKLKRLFSWKKFDEFLLPDVFTDDEEFSIKDPWETI